MRIIFVRHGEPNYEKDCLTPQGHVEAQAAAARLKDEGIEQLFSSPQGRALETARYTALKLGNMRINVLDFMHEIHWGSIDAEPIFSNGHPWDAADEMVRRGEDLTSPGWRESDLFKRNRATVSADYVASEFDKFIVKLGYRREGLYYREITGAENAKTVALFSHGGSSTAALSHLMNLTFPYLCSLLHMPFTAICILRFDHRAGSLCLPHLELAGDARHTLGL
ncbi:MAG: histidine phosphatase family protein [Clostridia bacterium]|nr:histidine phosphatase family protein [Clostridia bacterium]